MNDFEYNMPHNNDNDYRFGYTDPDYERKKKKRFGCGTVIAAALCSAMLCGTVSSAGMYYLLTNRENSSVVGGASSEDDIKVPVSSGTVITNQTTGRSI